MESNKTHIAIVGTGSTNLQRLAAAMNELNMGAAAAALRVTTAAWEAFWPVIEAAAETFARISEIVAPYVCADYEWEMAQLWACAARPKWWRIYNRTKKRRTRKKYYDKIVREYRKEHPWI